MVLSNRVKDILEIIINSKDYITIAEIAKKLGTSERTIYREIPEVTEIMNRCGVSLSSVSRKGLLMTGLPQDVQKLYEFMKQQDDILIVDPKERSDFIILYLANEEDYVKAEAIAIDNQTSVPTVRKDLKQIKEKINNYDLQLIQKKGEGIIIQGKRMEKYHLIMDVVMEHVDEISLYMWLRGKEQVKNPFLQRLESFGYQDIMSKFHRMLKDSINKAMQDISGVQDRNYLETIFLLSFLIYNHQTGHPYHDFMEAGNLNESLLKLYQIIVDEIQHHFELKLSENETSYIRWVIELCMSNKLSHVTTIRNQTLNTEIMEFIQYVENKMGIYLSRDHDLKDGLYCHMDKALSRIRSNMSISNPTTAEIKDKYEELFRVIKEGVRELFPNDFFPDDEIAYLVLYFAVALDKFTKKAFRVMVVCSSGIGSSRMLANRLEHDIPELKVEKIIPVVALEKENIREYDLVLSTVPLYLDDTEYLYVSPMLKENELQKIKDKIKRHKHRTLRKIEVREKEKQIFKFGNSMEVLKKVNRLTNMIMEMMTTFQIIEISDGNDMKEDAKKTLEMYQSFGMFKEAKPNSEVQKPNQGFVIPTTQIAYYEEACENMAQPLLFINQYDTAQDMKADSYRYEIVLFCSDKMEKFEQNMLQYYVDLFISDSELFELIEQKNEKAVREWIGYRMKQYLVEMMK